MTRVLFIGNSHTYYNDMPQMVRSLWQEAGGRGTPLEVADRTAGGVSLQWHWGQKDTHELVQTGAWDFVVLQERSGGPLEKPQSMRKHAGRWIELVRASRARPILYMTWAARSAPRTIATIAELYQSIGADHDVPVAAVGRAWATSLAARPDLVLHDDDGRHASPAGSYLAACCLYRTLSGADLGGDAWGPSGINAIDRAHLQNVADRMG